MKLKVSVIVPCFNAENTIGRALESLKRQTIKGFEVIVADDASTDRTLEIAKRHASKVIALKQNKGVSFARNRAIEKASGDILLFIDADCWAEPDWAEKKLHALESGSDATAGRIVVPRSTFFANAVAELGFPGGANAGFERMWPVSQSGFTQHVSTCNFGIKKEVLEKVGFFDEALRRGQDAYLSFLLSRQGARISYVPDAVVFHEPMTSFRKFFKNNVMRGKANRLFRLRVGNVRPFVSLRLWSSKNILKKNLRTRYLFPVIFLLSLSFVLQQVGYLKARLGRE